MKEKLVSIIIPVYNVEKYIDRCIVSVVNQTYENLEIILIDDGSTDMSAERCDAWKAKDARVQVIHKKNGGLSDARNAGLANATGEYVLFVDSDDWISLNTVEGTVNAIEKYDADMVVFEYNTVYEDGRIVRQTSPDYETECFGVEKAIQLLLEDKKITSHVWRKLYKNSRIGKDIFPVGKNFEDIFVMHQLFLSCRKIVYLNEAYYFYLQNSKGICGSRRLSDCKAHFEAVDFRYKELIELCPHLKKELEWSKLISDYTIWTDIQSGNGVKSDRIDLEKTIRADIACHSSKGLALWKRLGLFGIEQFPALIKDYQKFFQGMLKKFYAKVNKLVFSIRYIRKLIHIRGKRFYIICAPDHGNLGDQALLFAELRFIHKFFCNYEPCVIPMNRMSRVTVFLLKWLVHKSDYAAIQAGGNMGSLYPGIHQAQERVIKSLRHRKLIVFPQTYYYDNSLKGIQMLHKTQMLYKKCSDLRIFVREEVSYQFVKEHISSHVNCMPDMALYLPKYEVKAKREGVALCLRNDSEKTMTLEEYERIIETLRKYSNTITEIDTHIYMDNISMDYAKREIERLWKKIGASELMVTDRLHGMIFAVITETPCVVLASKSHKVAGVYEWVKELGYIQLITNIDKIDEAVEHVLKYPKKKHSRQELNKYYDLMAEIIRR